jgi:hypothetical protein
MATPKPPTNTYPLTSVCVYRTPWPSLTFSFVYIYQYTQDSQPNKPKPGLVLSSSSPPPLHHHHHTHTHTHTLPSPDQTDAAGLQEVRALVAADSGRLLERARWRRFHGRGRDGASGHMAMQIRVGWL